MKKVISILAFSVVLTGAILTSCQSKEQKVEDSKQQVVDAKQDLKEAKQELNADYPAFKRDAEEQIAANDKRIAELREKLARSGKAPLDNMRRQRIDELQKENAELRSRLYGYEKERSDWETFKRKFNEDAAKLRQAFKDFGNDLK